MYNNPLVSIITPVLNAEETIEITIQSVLSQSYKNIEHIVVDNGSSDGTLEIVNKYKNKIKIFSEGKKGIFTTMNRGLRAATGDIIGILNSDDFYADDDVIKTVVEKMNEDNVDACWGDLEYVDKNNINKVIRYWRSSGFSISSFAKGWMPPHPTLFVKKWVYDKYGFFNTDFTIAADYELVLRFLYKYRIPACYIPKVLVKMRTGGLSNQNIKTIIRKSREDYKICKLYGFNFFTLLNKNLTKISQFIFHY